MASEKCGILNPNYKDLIDIIEDWALSEKTRGQMSDPYEAAFKLADTTFNIPDFELLKYDNAQERLTEGSLNNFRRRLEELNEGIDRGRLGGGPSGGFSEFFWQSSRYGAKDPVVGKYLRDMQDSSFYFRKNELRDKTKFSKIIDLLKQDSGINGLADNFSYEMAQRKLSNLDNDLVKALNDGNDTKVAEIRKEIETIITKGELKSFGEFMEIVEVNMKEASVAKYDALKQRAKLYKDGKGDKKYKKDWQTIKEVDEGKKVIRLTELEMGNLLKDKNGKPLKNRKEMFKAVVEYDGMMNDLYQTLRKGTDKVIDVIIKRSELNGNKKDAQDLKEIKKKLSSELMPKYEQGFFPHYTRDLSAPFMQEIAPHLDELRTASNPYLKDKKKTVREVIADINTSLSEHAKGRKEEGEYAYSKNFLNVVNNYITDVNKFNFTSFVNSNFIDSISGIEKIYKKEGTSKDYGENLVSYIQDLNMAANGDNNLSPKTREVMRTLLGFEFISKLGINPRSAARNFTQRLLDYVEWGPVQISKMKNVLKTISLTTGGKSVDSELYVEAQLRDAGLLFDEASPQLIESGLSGPASMFNLRQWNDSAGKYEIIEKGSLGKFADFTSAVAAKSSWLHRKAENSNRKHTFKIAFAQMYSWMKDNPSFLQKKKDEWGDKFSNARLERSIQDLSGNYAKNMVIMNHFDYADYAKSKMMRSNVGRFMFQFQHYSMEFFERNVKILREAKGDVLAGNFLPNQNARGIEKAYRMGLAYFLAPVIGAALTGIDFSNLVEHDSANRINQLATLLTGDEDEIKKAFYGKGPILSTFGGPLASDILDIGIMYDLIDLDDDSLLTILTGMQEYDLNTQSTDLTKKIRILNTFLGRTVERHIPQLDKSNIGWTMQQELGLYSTKEAKEIQKTYKKYRKKVLPSSIERSLRRLEEGLS